jgi:hypothetical protein
MLARGLTSPLRSGGEASRPRIFTQKSPPPAMPAAAPAAGADSDHRCGIDRGRRCISITGRGISGRGRRVSDGGWRRRSDDAGRQAEERAQDGGPRKKLSHGTSTHVPRGDAGDTAWPVQASPTGFSRGTFREQRGVCSLPQGAREVSRAPRRITRHGCSESRGRTPRFFARQASRVHFLTGERARWPISSASLRMILSRGAPSSNRVPMAKKRLFESVREILVNEDDAVSYLSS